MSINKRIGFIGSGQMAEALARGLINKGVVSGDKMVCSDPNPARKEVFSSFGATPYESNVDVSGIGDGDGNLPWTGMQGCHVAWHHSKVHLDAASHLGSCSSAPQLGPRSRAGSSSNARGSSTGHCHVCPVWAAPVGLSPVPARPRLHHPCIPTATPHQQLWYQGQHRHRALLLARHHIMHTMHGRPCVP